MLITPRLIFQLTVASFENLSNVTSPCYYKVVSIIKSVATYRWCLVMLDRIIVDMFQLLFLFYMPLIDNPTHMFFFYVHIPI